MKNQPVILLVVAVFCGLVAMFGVRQALNRTPTDVEETVKILSAVAPIQPGESLDETNTKFTEIAASSVPDGAITAMEDVLERSMKVPALPGDWILKAKLTEPGDRGAVSLIPDGMVAVCLPVDATQSHSGMLRPGNRVDLLLTYADTSSGVSRQATITVLECVEVFAVDDRVSGVDKTDNAAAKNISLLVTPDQGKAVTLAKNVGTLSTMMRRRTDQPSGSKQGISQEFLTSSFMGSNYGAASTLDNLVGSEDPEGEQEDGGQLLTDMDNEQADAERDLTMDELIDRELKPQSSSDPGGSEPVMSAAETPEKNTWTMEIHEGGTVRVESIELPETAAPEGETGSGWSIWGLLKKS